MTNLWTSVRPVERSPLLVQIACRYHVASVDPAKVQRFVRMNLVAVGKETEYEETSTDSALLFDVQFDTWDDVQIADVLGPDTTRIGDHLRRGLWVDHQGMNGCLVISGHRPRQLLQRTHRPGTDGVRVVGDL